MEQRHGMGGALQKSEAWLLFSIYKGFFLNIFLSLSLSLPLSLCRLVHVSTVSSEARKRCQIYRWLWAT